MRKNGFLTFCFSFIPGAGQMYQGYMKRGLSILILFALACGLSAILSTGLFAIPIPVIIVYSFFDTFNLRSKILNNNSNIDSDDYIWTGTEFEKFFDKFKISKKNTVLGVVFLVLGIYLVLNSVVRQIAYQYDLDGLYFLINDIMSYLPPIVIAGLSIGIGIKFITNKK